MRRQIEKILKTVVGLMAGIIVVGLVEAVGMAIWPVPHEVQNAMSDAATMAAAMAQVPVGAKLFVVIAWAVGSFVGGCVTGLVRGQRAQARVVGILMLALVMTMLMTIPHPAWMALAGLLLPLPAALLGGRLCRRAPAV